MTDNNQNVDDSEIEIDEAFAEDAGTLVFQSSLMKFISEIEDDEANNFEAYIEAHVSEDDFIDTLFAKYPKFKEIFEEEMSILQTEMKEMTDEI